MGGGGIIGIAEMIMRTDDNGDERIKAVERKSLQSACF